MTRSVEKRGATVEEAVAAALAELGIQQGDAQIDVLDRGRRGLFGGGRRAHVRVTERAKTGGEAMTDSQPERATTPPPGEPSMNQEQDVTEADAAVSVEQSEDPVVEDQAPLAEDAPRRQGDLPAEEELTAEERASLLDEDADLAADFVEGLLDLLDLPGDIEIEVQDDQAIINVSDIGSGLLIGRRGATLDALQELVRCATQRQTERRSYVRVDVEGYRARQLDKLRAKCRDAIAQVRETGEPVRLEPMDAYERKMMHDLVAKTGGVTSSSEGSEPKRRVVIHPAE